MMLADPLIAGGVGRRNTTPQALGANAPGTSGPIAQLEEPPAHNR